MEIKFLKDCMLCTTEQLAHLYNLILRTSKFPEAWKRDTVVPIFKSGIKYNVTNYQPISLLPQFVKSFEKLIHTLLMDHIEENNIMNPGQGGSRRYFDIGDFFLLKLQKDSAKQNANNQNNELQCVDNNRKDLTVKKMH